MSEGREIGRGVRQGCPLLPTLNIYLDDLMKNRFLNTGGVNIGGRRIKYIRFTDDMALLLACTFARHVWDMVGRRLIHQGPPAPTLDALWTRIHTAWRDIPQEDI